MAAAQESKLWSILAVLFTGGLYIGSSAGLIAYNKKVMAPDKFPFSAGLGLLHASFCSLAAAVTFQVKPSLFPSLTDPAKKMLKESNVVWVYLLSVVCAVEVFGWRQFRLVVLIMFATFITIRGELHFTLPGFLLQASSCFAETIKITMQGVLLTSSGKGLDALSYMLIVMPTCALMFGGVFALCSLVAPYHQIIAIPTLADWINMKWMLLGNAFVALTLNFSGMLFIRCSSAVSYVLAGIMKDVMIVVAGILFMGHETSSMQASGFTLQVSLILLWSLLKTFPKEFKNGLIDGFQVIFLGKTLEEPAKEPALAASVDDDDGAIKK